MGSDFNRGERLVKNIIGALALMFCIACAFGSSGTTRGPSYAVSAAAIRGGCSIFFSKELHPFPDDALSAPPFDVDATWNCRDGENLAIDQFKINGSSPEVVTVFYWKKRDIVMLVRWSPNSQAADYSGDYYQIFICEYARKLGKGLITKNESMMERIPPGWDGFDNSTGKKLTYPFKDAASIRRRLQAISH